METFQGRYVVCGELIDGVDDVRELIVEETLGEGGGWVEGTAGYKGGDGEVAVKGWGDSAVSVVDQGGTAEDYGHEPVGC